MPLVLAMGEDLPFADSLWDGVFVECSLSVAKNADRVLGECSRVLTDGGRLVLSDLYMRDSSITAADCHRPSTHRLAGIHKQGRAEREIEYPRLSGEFWEDQSPALKEFVAQLILSHGRGRRSSGVPLIR